MNRRLLINVCVVAALLGAGLVLVLGNGEDDSKAPAASSPTSSLPSGVVKTDLPDLTPATGEPEPDDIRTAPAAPRNVTVLPGPFDDRFTFSDLRFDGSAVSGKVTIISDVSDVRELQVLAGFYSANGTFLGEARFTRHLDEKQGTDDAVPPSEGEPFQIAVPAKFRGQAKSASVGVPVLVNE